MKLKFIYLLLIGFILVLSVLDISIGYKYQGTPSITSSNDWYFLALGDTRNWGENDSNPVRAALINSIVENNPNLEFILHSGDMVYHGGEQDDWDRYFEDIENATNNNIDFYYAVGNHEYYTYNLPDGSYGPPDEDLSTYLANVDLPGNEKYYSFDFNDQIHFVFINSDELSDENQITWLINDLETTPIEFVVLVTHRPAYSVRDSSRVAAAQSIRAVIEPILNEYDIDVVFAGHDHYYYRTLRKGVLHIVTGGGGAPLASNNDLSDWQEGDVFFSEYHYCNVSVTQSGENIVIKVEMLIFDEIEGTTTLGDSCEISNIEETTTLTPTATETTTSKSTPMVLLFTIIGISFASFLRKKGKSNNR